MLLHHDSRLRFCFVYIGGFLYNSNINRMKELSSAYLYQSFYYNNTFMEVAFMWKMPDEDEEH